MGELKIPGFVDMHVHFREPGFKYKETIKSGSAAAAAGGFTTVCTMPNLDPVPDDEESLKIQRDIIAKDAIITVIPFASITKGRKGDNLVNYAALAPYVAGFSDDGSGVQSEEVMREAMKGIAATGKILAAHCEVELLVRGGYVNDSALLRSKGHRGICAESEWMEIERDIRLAEETGCRLHICHVSTKEGVMLVRNAKRRGVKVTAETAPHYLMFCDEDIRDEGRFKMNPPIRCKADMEALREGLADGTVDIVATDHAPHSFNEKNGGLRNSAMGIVGLETAFPAVYTVMVKSGLMPISRLIDAMSLKPREILELPLEEGDYTLVDTDREIVIDSRNFRSMGKSSPFDGMALWGEIRATYHNNKNVFPE